MHTADLLALIGAGVLVLMLLRAMVHKLAAFEYFVATVAEYRLLPRSAAKPAAVVILGAELLAVALLIPTSTRVAGALLAATLLVVYAAAMGINLQRGRVEIDCGCGGGGQSISGWLVVRNAWLTVLCLCVAWLPPPSGLGGFDVLVVVGCVVALWMLMMICDQVLGNHSHVRSITHSRLQSTRAH